MAQVLGAASATVNTRTTLMTMATATPQAPKKSSASRPRRVAPTSWQMSRVNSTGFKKRSGRDTSHSSRSPRWPLVSAMACALLRDTWG